MTQIELSILSGDQALPASLTLPADGKVRAGLVVLHGAAMPQRNFFLYRHLAELLPEHGVAVLRYDRRPSDREVPFDLQVADAQAAMRVLREHAGCGQAPLGLWGFSQGAWTASIAAAGSAEVAFLVLVGSAGMSPARQMRYGTARRLRDRGYDAEALRELAELRVVWEAYLRGEQARQVAQAVIARYAARPWFPLVYVPSTLPEPGSWQNMDFDPEPVFSRAHCPVLLFYGENDEWVPIDESVAAWQRAAEGSGNRDLTVVRLPGTSHTPTLERGETMATISPAYTEQLVLWLGRQAGVRPGGARP